MCRGVLPENGGDQCHGRTVCLYYNLLNIILLITMKVVALNSILCKYNYLKSVIRQSQEKLMISNGKQHPTAKIMLTY